MGQKPDDWNTVSLCKVCHAIQHKHGERTFWGAAKLDPDALAAAFANASPKAAEIRQIKRERANVG